MIKIGKKSDWQQNRYYKKKIWSPFKHEIGGLVFNDVLERTYRGIKEEHGVYDVLFKSTAGHWLEIKKDGKNFVKWVKDNEQ